MKYVKVFTPPLNWDNSKYTIDGIQPVNVFLAGTIDNGDSEDWQQTLIDTISGVELKKPVMVYNPVSTTVTFQGSQCWSWTTISFRP